MTRYPFELLEAAIGAPSTVALAELLDVHPRQIYRWRDYGVSDVQAEEFAFGVGLHVYDVWPEHLRWARCGWCREWISQDRHTRGPRRRTCSRRCKDALSRSRHLEQRRAVDRERYHARRTPELLAARARAAREARAAA